MWRPETGVVDLDEGKFFLKRLVDLASFFFIKIGAPGNLAFLFAPATIEVMVTGC
jgi:hypothetical protein